MQKKSDADTRSKPERPKTIKSYKEYFLWLIDQIEKRLPPEDFVDIESNKCSFAELKEAAEGLWEEIVYALCIDPEEFFYESPYTIYQRCPVCGEGNKFKRFYEFEETGACRCFHCHREGSVDGIGMIAWTLGIETFSNAPNLYAKNLIWYALKSGLVQS